MRAERAPEGPGPLRILGIHWAHFLWLWAPASFWASILVPSLYLCWLDICLGYHWLIHPSLWFSFTWWLYLGIGLAFTVFPLMALFNGMGGALDALAVPPGHSPTGKGAAAVRFLFSGIGLGILLSMLLLAVGFWIVSQLPMVTNGQKPWWVIF